MNTTTKMRIAHHHYCVCVYEPFSCFLFFFFFYSPVHYFDKIIVSIFYTDFFFLLSIFIHMFLLGFLFFVWFWCEFEWHSSVTTLPLAYYCVISIHFIYVAFSSTAYNRYRETYMGNHMWYCVFKWSIFIDLHYIQFVMSHLVARQPRHLNSLFSAFTKFTIFQTTTYIQNYQKNWTLFVCNLEDYPFLG